MKVLTLSECVNALQITINSSIHELTQPLTLRISNTSHSDINFMNINITSEIVQEASAARAATLEKLEGKIDEDVIPAKT